MQTLLHCLHYCRNDNLNKTCTLNKERCKLYYCSYCGEYDERINNNERDRRIVTSPL